MAKKTAKPTIFISYSHRDKKWLEYVKSHLLVAVTNDYFDLWDDERLSGGDPFKKVIDDALRRATIVILLISAHSLTSNFILKHEVKVALERRARQGAAIFPIVVRPCAIDAVPWLRNMNLRPRDGVALILYPLGRRDKIMSDLTEEVRGMLNRRVVKNVVMRKSAIKIKKARTGSPRSRNSFIGTPGQVAERIIKLIDKKMPLAKIKSHLRKEGLSVSEDLVERLYMAEIET